MENAENAQEEKARNPLPIDDRKDAHDDASDPSTTTRLLPPPAPTTPDNDYMSDDRNDDFDGVKRNHAFDNDFDLDMHEPGD